MGGNGVSEKMSHSEYLDEFYDKRFTDIELDLKEIRSDLAFIRETLVKADATITKVSAEVMPTLDSVMQSPMLKMLMPKGKK